MTTYRRFALAGLAIAFLAPVSAAPQGPQASYDSVHVNGVSLAYRVMGAGEPLVLLHGFFGTGDSWSALFDVLSSSHRLIVPDLRGHGRSSNPTGTFTHRQSAADIFALLDHLGVNRFRAMGFSSGGMTLLHMATTQPNRIETMILVGATSYFPEEARRIIRANAPDSVSAERLEDYASRHGSVEKGEALIRQFNGFQNSFGDMNFTPPLLATIRARTLIVHGDRDPFFPVHIPVEQYQAIPDSYLWVVPNGGHETHPRAPAARRRFTETILEFLSGDWN